MITVDSRPTVGEYIFLSKYSQTFGGKKETWNQAVNRVMDMHVKQYRNRVKPQDMPEFLSLFEKAYKLYHDQRILGAQRALQYGGELMTEKVARFYNCTMSHCNRVEFFEEAMYLLLCGCGVGYSVQKKHTEQLPVPKGFNHTVPNERVVCPDTIEGWAMCVGTLMKAYYYGDAEPDFDLSLIRKKGAYIRGGFRAPGPEPLRQALDKMKSILVKIKGRKLTPFELHYLICIFADSVVTGGVRRSAMIALFDADDNEMATCKTGSWMNEKKELCRSNNSAVILPNTPKELFDKIFKSTKAYGEPGFVFLDDPDYAVNPCCEVTTYPVFRGEDGVDHSGWGFCVSGNTKLITKEGITEIKNAVGKKVNIWNGVKWCEVVPFHTGVHELYHFELSDGSYIDATDYHKFLWKSKPSQNDWEEGNTLQLMAFSQNNPKAKIILPKPNIKEYAEGVFEEFAYEYGFFQGDGTIKVSKVEDRTYFYPTMSLFKKSKKDKLPIRGQRGYETKDKVRVYFKDGDLDLCFKLKDQTIGIPEKVFQWDRKSILNYVAGLADADGSNHSHGILIYGCEHKIKDLQLLLTKIGIESNVSLFRKSGVETNFGMSKQDVWKIYIKKTIEIPCHRLKCDSDLEFNQQGKYLYVKSVTKLEGRFDTYCVEEPELHQCTFNNVLTKQCNLAEINGSKVKTVQDFYEACEAAAVICTLQAGYTNFKVLSRWSQKIAERDALIGVGITGLCENPDILFDPDVQREGAEIVVATNKKVAKLIGINPAARCTVVKPSGNSSQLLGTLSGITPGHARHYIRHVQAADTEQALQAWEETNPECVEPSAWAPDREKVLAFPVTLPKNALLRENLSAVEFLQLVLLTKNNWIEYGTNFDHPQTQYNPKLRMNVSNTCTVKEHEWDEVREFLWEHKTEFGGVSLLSYYGDLDYPQAPYTEVLDEHQLAERYGAGAILSSGLVVDSKDVFKDVWEACNAAMGLAPKLLELTDKEISEFIVKHIKNGKFLMEIDGVCFSDVNCVVDHLRHKVEARLDWIRRFNSFADKYMGGDRQLTAYCLKHVNAYHKWQHICRFQKVDYSNIVWEQPLKEAGSEIATACSGGSCTLEEWHLPEK